MSAVTFVKFVVPDTKGAISILINHSVNWWFFKLNPCHLVLGQYLVMMKIHKFD